MNASDLMTLSRAGRTPPLPLRIRLDDETSLDVEQWLRVLPGKRYVAKARWQDRVVLVKLYVGRRAQQKMQREYAGCDVMREKALPTPGLLCRGAESEQGAWIIFDYLEGARTLTQIGGLSVEGTPEIGALPDSIVAVAELLAKLHGAGLLQMDIHPNNFLCQSGAWFLIDGDGVQQAKDEAAVARNLGQFMAQLPQQWQQALLAHYFSFSSLSLKADEIMSQAGSWRQWRARDFGAKSLRDCTLFRVSKSWRRFESIWREEADWLVPVLADLDSAMARSKALKLGGSATVGLLDVDGRPVVIKRYNLKNWWHRLKRCWRPTRAWHSWQIGHCLRVLGIESPRPLAMVEERWGPLRGRGYLITEYSPGEDIISAFEKADEAQAQLLTERLARMLANFKANSLSHGDLKGTNLLWQPGLQGEVCRLALIDLDAACWHKGRRSWRKAFSKDVARLLRNFSPETPAYRELTASIQKAGLSSPCLHKSN